MEEIARHKCFDGDLSIRRHTSTATQCPMEFSIFVPPGKGPFPTLIFLSGLTCTWENFTTKAGAYGAAAKAGIIIIAPDTSPRGDGVADDPEGAYDLGLGASFYLNATEPPYAAHYRMEDYIARELPTVAAQYFPVDLNRLALSGHSMGGHGALTLGLKYPDLFKSITAFAPITAPSQVPWGQKAFAAYLGSDQANWQAHDATALMTAAGDRTKAAPILIDQGGGDAFLDQQLKPDLFAAACQKTGQPLTLRLQEGYDHSYYFITSFIADHIDWHRKNLSQF